VRVLNVEGKKKLPFNYTGKNFLEEKGKSKGRILVSEKQESRWAVKTQAERKIIVE